MNKQQWMASKARKRINMSLRLGLPLLALAFAAQIVIGSFNTVPTGARPGSETGGQQQMNDPNQEVTGGIANVGGVNGLGGPMNGNGGVSGSVVKGSSANPKAITKMGATIIEFDGKTLVFDYFGIRITGHLSPAMVTKWKDSPELVADKLVVLYVREQAVVDGFEKSDGVTADIGDILKIEASSN